MDFTSLFAVLLGAAPCCARHEHMTLLLWGLFVFDLVTGLLNVLGLVSPPLMAGLFLVVAGVAVWLACTEPL